MYLILCIWNSKKVYTILWHTIQYYCYDKPSLFIESSYKTLIKRDDNIIKIIMERFVLFWNVNLINFFLFSPICFKNQKTTIRKNGFCIFIADNWYKQKKWISLKILIWQTFYDRRRNLYPKLVAKNDERELNYSYIYGFFANSHFVYIYMHASSIYNYVFGSRRKCFKHISYFSFQSSFYGKMFDIHCSNLRLQRYCQLVRVYSCL